MANGLKAIGIIAIVLFAAFASNLPALFHLFYALTSITLLCALWAWESGRSIEVKREVETLRVQIGENAVEHILIRNTSLIPKLWVVMKDHSTLPNHRASCAFMLPPRSVKRLTVTTVCQRRGEYVLGPCSVSTGDPFGIFQRVRFFDQNSTLIVYPRTIDLPHFDATTGELQGGYVAHQRTQHITPMAVSVREYVPGDSLSRIHWPSSARAGRLMAKEFELDPARDVWLMLDLERAVQGGTGDESTEEYGVTIAASLAKHFLRQNRAVGFISCGVSYEIIHSDRGVRQLLKILERLAIAKAEGRKPLAEIIAAESVRFGPNATVVAISPSTDPAWADALRSLRQRRVHTIAVVIDAGTFDLRGAGNGGLRREALSESVPAVIGGLIGGDVATYVVRQGDSLQTVFAPEGGRS